MTDDVIISGWVMAKNEEQCIAKTLRSLVGMDRVVLYDTGSTDKTIDISRAVCLEENLPLYVFEKSYDADFNFAVARNDAIRKMENELPELSKNEFLVALDANDEMRGIDSLREFLRRLPGHIEGVEVTRELLMMEGRTVDSFKSFKCIRRGAPWHYFGVVHETMVQNGMEDIQIITPDRIASAPDDVVIFQDRTQQENESYARYERDKTLLMRYHQAHPNDSRTVFYLAQTYECLNIDDMCFHYYKKRSVMPSVHEEETFLATYRCGTAAHRLQKPPQECIEWFLRSLNIRVRAEPLMCIGALYMSMKNHTMAYTFLKAACDLPYPKDARMSVDVVVYTYRRFSLLALAAYAMGAYTEAHAACLAAIATPYVQDSDFCNLRFIRLKMKQLGILGTRQPAASDVHVHQIFEGTETARRRAEESGCIYRLWTEEAADWFVRTYTSHLYKLYTDKTLAGKSEMLRVLLLKVFGGIFLDASMECDDPKRLVQSFPHAGLPLLSDYGNPLELGTAILTSPGPNHIFWTRVADELETGASLIELLKSCVDSAESSEYTFLDRDVVKGFLKGS